MSELRERVRVGIDGRVAIPKSIRRKLGIKEGSTILEVYPLKENKIIMEVLVK